MLPDKAFPAKFPTGSSPWTVFVRTQAGGSESVPILYWGASGNASAKHVRFYTVSNPRYVMFNTGTSGSVSGSMLPAGNDGSGATWANVAFSYDGNDKVAMYLDGRLIESKTITKLDITAESFVVCGNPTDATKTTSEYVDDVIVYDRKLSADEIRTVARSMETGAITPSLSANSAVSVASGAKLQFKGLGHELKALTGAGTVEMAPGSLLDIGGTLAFTGAFTGSGALRIGSGLSLASSTVATDVYVSEDAVYGTSSLPIVETTGRAFLPEKLTIDVDGEVAGSWIEVLAAGAFEGPTDFSKWTVTGKNAHPVPRFKIVDGKLYVHPVRTGLTMIVR